MKLAAKVSVVLAALLLVVLGISAWIDLEREHELLRSDMRADHLVEGALVATAFKEELETDGVDVATALLRRASANQGELQLRFIDWTAEPAPDLTAEERAQLSRRTAVFRETDAPYPGRASTYLPVSGVDGRPAALEISESLGPQRVHLAAILRRAAVSTLVLVTLCVALTMVVGGLVVGRPLRRIADHAQKIGAGDFETKLRLGRQDEIGRLGESMDSMSSQLAALRRELLGETERRVEALDALRHAERLTTVGKLASGIAHELGTPLTVIHGHAQIIAGKAERDPEIGRSATVIAQKASRMTELIAGLLDFARRRHPRADACDLVGLLRETASLVEAIRAKHGVAIAWDVGPDLPRARGDSAQIKQVFTNLLVNAFQAMPTGGHLRLAVELLELEPPVDHGGPRGAYLRVTVRDDGAGITAADLPHVFEPFFTTKEVGDGTGLGLSIAYGIVSDHGGWMTVASDPGRGATFAVHFAPAAASPPVAPGGSEATSVRALARSIA